MSDPALPFNRQAVRAHRARAAAGLGDHDFLFREVAERLADRLSDIKRTFPVALDLGCHGGGLGRTLGGRGGVETLLSSDLAPALAAQAGGLRFAADEEFLPLRPASLDLVISCLALHWVNDLPGALVQVRRALRPDALFLAALFGGATLAELRASLTAAEIAIEGGASPRVSPFADIRDLGALLQRAGFALPVCDVDRITVSYQSPFKLMADLRGMGEANALNRRRPGFTRRATMMAAAEHYQKTYGDAEGRVPATFEVITLTAWAPDPSQPQPLAPGSAEASLAEALGGDTED